MFIGFRETWFLEVGLNSYQNKHLYSYIEVMFFPYAKMFYEKYCKLELGRIEAILIRVSSCWFFVRKKKREICLKGDTQ